jgi:hypothetical protein
MEMISLILQLGLWMNTDGSEHHVNCPIIYEQEQRLPVGCTVLAQGILYSPQHFINTKMNEADAKAQISALQDQISILRAELVKTQNQLTQCLIKPQPSTTQPFIYGVLTGSILSGAILWNK